MFRKSFFLILFILYCKAAAAGDGVYFRGFGGINFINISEEHDEKYTPHVGYVVGASCGHKFLQAPFRIEGEFSFRDNTFDISFLDLNNDKKHLKYSYYKLVGYLNLLVDIPLKSAICPYFGGGIGYGYDQIKLLSSTRDVAINFLLLKLSTRGLSYQAIGGLCFPCTETIDIRTDYRYAAGRFRSINNHSLTFSLLKTF